MSLHNVIEFRQPKVHRDKTHVRSAPLSILSVGRNPEILRTRQRVLTVNSDLDVRSMTPEEAEPWARATAPRVWIFCSSIELPRLVHLACTVRRYCPESRLLLLEGPRDPGFAITLFHRVLQPLEGPDVLLEAVSHLAVAV